MCGICELTVFGMPIVPAHPNGHGLRITWEAWKLASNGSTVVGGGDESAGLWGCVANLGASRLRVCAREQASGCKTGVGGGGGNVSSKRPG
jgi:hypothetical protein